MSYLLKVTEKKILNKILKNKVALTASNIEDKLKIIDDLKLILKNKSLTSKYGYSWDDKLKKSVLDKTCIIIEFSKKISNNWFGKIEIDFDKNNLKISTLNLEERFLLDDINKVALIIDEFYKEFELAENRESHKANNEIKRQKIKGIKRNAILATLNQIATEQGFEYMIESYVSKVKIYIRLSKNDFMEIDVPYKNFQDVLQQVTNAYKAVKDLKDKNIPIKIKYSIYTEGMDWEKNTNS